MPDMPAQEAITIRSMSEPDLDAILTIEQVSYPKPWKREHFLQEIHSPLSFPSVAVFDGTVIGYVCLMSLFEEAQIMNIAVAPQQRGQGVAAMLLEQSIVTARKCGAQLLILEVRVSNAVAIRLYERFGFVQFSLRKKYYANNEDALLMEKALALAYQE